MTGLVIRKVLLADDDADMRRLAQLVLARVGKWQVFVAASGETALEIATRELPDLVVLDVSMPGMDGPEVLRRLREQPATAEIPVVFITARAFPEEVEAHVRAGAAGVVTKPFDPLQLPARLLEILARRRGVAPGPAPGAELLATLAKEKDAYVASLPQKVAALAAALAVARVDASEVPGARTLAHKLKGSAGAHGLPEVSAAAGRMEEQLRALESGSEPGAVWPSVDAAFAAIRAASK